MPRTSVISIFEVLRIAIGRLERVCGEMGTSAIAESEGCRIGPPAESAYAVDPVGEATINPSARSE
jgi:hypothetical protein